MGTARELGLWPKAAKIGGELQQLAATLNFAPVRAEFHHEYADNLWRVDRGRESVEQLQQAVFYGISGQRLDIVASAQTQLTMGAMFDDPRGERVEREFQQARASVRAAGPSPTLEAELENVRALRASLTGNLTAATHHYERSWSLYERAGGDFEIARAFAQQGLDAARLALGDEHPKRATFEHELAAIHRAQGQMGRANQHDSRAFALQQSTALRSSDGAMSL